MFTSTVTTQKRKWYFGPLTILAYATIGIAAFVGNVLADTDLPPIHQDILLAMPAATVPPPEPPAPAPPPEAPKAPQPDLPNPDAAPPEAPDKISPEPPERLKLPSGPPDKICINCVVGGDPNNKPIFETPPPLPPPPAPPEPQKPLRVSESQAPKQLARVNPIYPPIAQSARVEGIVILEATIDVSGNVVNVTVLRGQPLLNEAAVAAVRQWKYQPHRLNGQPVPVIMTVTVNFTLKEPA